MKIEYWEVERYKSVEDGKIATSDLTILIGKNNSGKSSIIDSLIDFQNNHSHASSTQAGGVSEGWVGKRVTGKSLNEGFSIRLQFGLSDQEREKIISVVNNSYNPRNRKRGAPTPDEIDDSNWFSNIKQQVDYNTNGSIDVTRWLNFQDEFVNVEELIGSDKVHGANFRSEVRDIVNSSVANWSFVLPFRDPQDTMDTYRRFNLDPRGENLVQVLDSLDRNRTEVFNRIANAYVDVMEGVTDLDIEYDPDGSARTITAVVYEESYNTKFKLSDISSGSKEILVLLTQLYLAAEESHVLAIEEPELHLHPEAEQKIFDIIAEIVSEEDTQVIVSTHSDVFVNQGEADSIVKVERDGQTSVRSIESKEIDEELRDLGYEKSGLLQSDAVIFVEGKSDKLILSQWASTLDIDFESSGISIIELEGEGNIETHGRSLVKLLQSFDIPYRFIVDSDDASADEVEHDFVSSINRNDAWWHTTPDHFHAWDDSDIEYFLLKEPTAIADVLNVSTDKVEEIIRESDAEKNADVLNEIWEEFHQDPHQEVTYRKDMDGMAIAKHMHEDQIHDEVCGVLSEINELP